MAGGLAALLDDIALIARKAAVQLDDVASVAGQTSVKSSALVIDDAAVTPTYVAGVSPARELPIIWRITKGSLVNKLLIVLPIALLLSWLAPWALPPILMCGGAYLSFEGAEKIWEYVSGGHEHEPVADQEEAGEEDTLVRSAIRTDLILSAEIMVLSLNEVAEQEFWLRLGVLIVVGIMLTVAVYGVVGLLIKMDDLGLALDRRFSGPLDYLGKALVKGMPKLLTVLTVVGTAAMLWVGGHILITGVADLGWHDPHELVVSLADAAGTGFLAWLVDTLCSAVVGFLLGSVLTGIVLGGKRLRRG